MGMNRSSKSFADLNLNFNRCYINGDIKGMLNTESERKPLQNIHRLYIVDL